MDAPWIEYILKTALCLAASYGLYSVLLKNDILFFGNRLFLLLMMPISFLLPLSPLESPFRSLIIGNNAGDLAMADPFSGAVQFDISAILTILYWSGVGLFGLRILFHLIHLWTLQRNHPQQRHGAITLVQVEAPIPPFSFFNRIFLHADQPGDGHSLAQIIAHESVHIRQLHSLDILIMELVVALQWFNPIVWFYKKALKETHEYLADREVIAQGFNAEGYRLLLFEQQFGAKLFEFASNLKQSQIKRRMFMMNKMKTTGQSPFKLLLALPLIALLMLILAEPRLIMANGEPSFTKTETAAMAAQNTEVKKGSSMSKQEIEETLKKIEEKEKHLKEKFQLASSDEEKQKLKQTLNELYQKRHNFMIENGIKPMESMPSLEDLEKKLQTIQEKKQKLKQIFSEEKDETKRAELKLKFEELKKFEEELKEKIASFEKKH